MLEAGGRRRGSSEWRDADILSSGGLKRKDVVISFRLGVASPWKKVRSLETRAGRPGAGAWGDGRASGGGERLMAEALEGRRARGQGASVVSRKWLGDGRDLPPDF